MKILYVEDNDINAFIMKKALRAFPLDLAANGERAMELIERQDYDLILMDINLGQGQKDGVEVMHEIRLRNRYKSIPIFAITAYVGKEFEQKFLSEGFDRYYSKPVDFKELEGVIGSLADRNN